jgi:hypothetical protein
MMRTVRAASLTFILAALATPASAQVVQSLGFGAGWFTPRAFDARVTGDVLVADLTQPVVPGYEPLTSSLAFKIGDFHGVPLFGEWNVAFGRHLEASAGVTYYSRKVHSVYADWLNEARGRAEIEQDLRLRMIPITAAVRFLPMGDATGFQPYVGGGVAIVPFRYTETGDFLDPSDLSIFNARFVASGTATGPVLLGGIRMPMGGDVYALTIEGRYQWVDGATGGVAKDFLGDRLDLSGGTVNFGLLIRF